MQTVDFLDSTSRCAAFSSVARRTRDLGSARTKLSIAITHPGPFPYHSQPVTIATNRPYIVL
jgi:hypothetical protein